MACGLSVSDLAYESSAAHYSVTEYHISPTASNFHPAVFERRRGIKPLAMSPAVAPGWRLAFDLRGGGAEPSFASARPDARRALRCSIRSHSVGLGARLCVGHVPFGYVVCPVRCRKLDADGEIEWAYTLAAAPGPMRIAREADEPTPVLGYLREGARLSGLPDSATTRSRRDVARSRAPAPIPAEDAARAAEKANGRILLMAGERGKEPKGRNQRGTGV